MNSPHLHSGTSGCSTICSSAQAPQRCSNWLVIPSTSEPISAVLRCAPYLGTEPSASSSCPLHRSRPAPGSRRLQMDRFLEPILLPVHALSRVFPRQVRRRTEATRRSEQASVSWRRNSIWLLPDASPTFAATVPAGLVVSPSHLSAAPNTFSLPGPLHSSRRHLQPSTRSLRERSRLLPLARLCPWRQAEGHDRFQQMSSCADFFFTFCPKAWSASATSASLPNRSRQSALARCRQLLGAAACPDRPETTNLLRCPACSGTMLVIERITNAQLYFRPDPNLATPQGAALTAHKIAIAYHGSNPCPRWHARPCKALVCPQAVQAPSLQHSLTPCRTQFCFTCGIPPTHLDQFCLRIGPISEPAPLKSIGRSPHPPQTPAAQFKRSYRNCPGRKIRLNPASSAGAVPIGT